MNKFIFALWTKYLPVVIGLLLTVSVTSCVYDDKAADCDNVILRFIYYADGEENVIQDYLYGIDVYIFDGKGKLVAKAHLTEQEIRAGTPLELDLPDGTYHAVAFGNDFDNTSLENILTPVDLERVSMYNPNSEKQTNDRNYFGKHTFEVTSSEEYFRPVVEETVEMKSAHTELRIGVKGLPGPKNPDQMPYYIELSGAVPGMDTNGNPTGSGTNEYRPVLRWNPDTGTYVAVLSFFRRNGHGEDGRNPEAELEQTTRNIYVRVYAADGTPMTEPISLWEFLQKNLSGKEIREVGALQEQQLDMRIEFSSPDKENPGLITYVVLLRWSITDGSIGFGDD